MRAATLVSRLTVGAVCLVALLIFSWPLLIAAEDASESYLAQSVFIALMPVLVILLLVEFSSGQIGSRQLALLGVLTALNAVVRLLGAGTAGIETAFFIILLGAYVFGSGFGFVLGAASLLVSALISGGFGPWLPFQMMAAGLLGLIAGLLPHPRQKWAQVSILAAWGFVGAFVYGGLMTLWNWPFLAGLGSSISYVPGDGFFSNFTRFLQYEMITGGLLWDLGRAITTVVLLVATGPALLTTLRRAANRAGFQLTSKQLERMRLGSRR